MRELKFPSYEWLKALPLKRAYTYTDSSGESWEMEEDCEYKITLFDTPLDTYGRFSYNEDGSGLIYFDVMEGGYTNVNDFGLALKFSRTNYKKICKHAQEVYESFFRELEKDMSYQWGCTPEEYFENEY